MEELGFRPNFAGAALRGGSYRSIGLCMYNITRVGNLATLEGIMQAAREHDFAVTMIEMGGDKPMHLPMPRAAWSSDRRRHDSQHEPHGSRF